MLKVVNEMMNPENVTAWGEKTGTFYFSDRLVRAHGAIVEYLEGVLCVL